MCFKKKSPVLYIEMYHNWMILEVKDAYTMHPSGQKTSVFVAVKIGDGTVKSGIDIPDLKADIDEAEI